MQWAAENVFNAADAVKQSFALQIIKKYADEADQAAGLLTDGDRDMARDMQELVDRLTDPRASGDA